MLEKLSGANSINFTIYFTHESNGNIWHEVENIYCGPSTLSVEIGWIGPLMSRRTLY